MLGTCSQLTRPLQWKLETGGQLCSATQAWFCECRAKAAPVLELKPLHIFLAATGQEVPVTVQEELVDLKASCTWVYSSACHSFPVKGLTCTMPVVLRIGRPALCLLHCTGPAP